LCFFLRVRFLFLLGVSERGEEAPCVHARIPSLTAPLSLLRGCGKKGTKGNESDRRENIEK
jgi:hypothetical protein